MAHLSTEEKNRAKTRIAHVRRMLGGGQEEGGLARTLAVALTPDNREHRAKIKAYLQTSPLFAPRYNIPLHSERELALHRLRAIQSGVGALSVKDFR